MYEISHIFITNLLKYMNTIHEIQRILGNTNLGNTQMYIYSNFQYLVKKRNIVKKSASKAYTY